MKGLTKKLLAGMYNVVSAPNIFISCSGTPISSLVSLFAVASELISSGSTYPPGNAICPLCTPEFKGRLISTVAKSALLSG